MLVDSHAHLDSLGFDKDRDNVIRSSGLSYILNVATDIKSTKFTLELTEKYGFVYGAIGIHPHHSVTENVLELKKYLDNPNIKAIGEIGLDFYRDYAPRDKQEEIFRVLLKEAETRSLPVIIHQRNAQKEILDILNDYSVTGVMHCFSGDLEFAFDSIANGFYISFAGNITYPKAENLRKIAKEISIDNILIETDCPWLAPQKMRGKRNEPKYVQYVAEEIARIKSMSLEEIGETTTGNFRKLFCI